MKLLCVGVQAEISNTKPRSAWIPRRAKPGHWLKWTGRMAEATSIGKNSRKLARSPYVKSIYRLTLPSGYGCFRSCGVVRYKVLRSVWCQLSVACDIICRRSLAAVCRIRARMDDWLLRRAEAHFGSIATVHSSSHLQGVVRATDSAITHVHGLSLTAPPTPAREELTTNNYKIPTTNNVANDTLPFKRPGKVAWPQRPLPVESAVV
jgi:hypothetical protein